MFSAHGLDLDSVLLVFWIEAYFLLILGTIKGML